MAFRPEWRVAHFGQPPHVAEGTGHIIFFPETGKMVGRLSALRYSRYPRGHEDFSRLLPAGLPAVPVTGFAVMSGLCTRVAPVQGSLFRSTRQGISLP